MLFAGYAARMVEARTVVRAAGVWLMDRQKLLIGELRELFVRCG